MIQSLFPALRAEEKMIFDGTVQCGCGCDSKNCFQVLERPDPKTGERIIVLRDSEFPTKEVFTDYSSFFSAFVRELLSFKKQTPHF